MKYKRLFTLVGVALGVLLGAISCATDDVEDDIVVAPDGYGEDLSFDINSDLSTGVVCDMNLPFGELEFTLLNVELDEITEVTVDHTLVDNKSTFSFEEHLPMGEYRVLMATYDIEDDEDTVVKGSNNTDDDTVKGLVMTCISIYIEQHESYAFPEDYNKTTLNPGSGTEDDPVQITCFMDLVILNYLRINNDAYAENKFYYKQMNDISFQNVSAYTGGFSGICTSASSPFVGYYDGGGHKITYLTVERFTSQTIDEEPSNHVAAAGLFGYVSDSYIHDLTIEEPYIIGYDAVGGLVGAVISLSGEASTATYISDCHIVDSDNSVMKIYGRQYVGGLVGAVDNGTILMLKDCSNSVTSSNATIMTRSYGDGHSSGYIGGLVGGCAASGDGSTINLVGCSNSTSISTPSAVAVGGLVGSCHVLYISDSENSGAISAPYAVLGCGGLAGGSGDATIIASKNSADVDAPNANGVGGIMGSSLYDYTTDDNGNTVPRFGNMVAVSAHNYGSISGVSYVGGMVGGSHIRTTGCFNKGDISSSGYSGGLVGYAPVCTALYSNNMGSVSGVQSGGMCGEAYYFTIATSNNLGSISGSDSSGGLIGRGGRFGAINYSNNFGDVMGSTVDYTGGIAGQLGNLAASSYVIGENSDDVKKCILKLLKAALSDGKEKGSLSEFIAEIKEIKEEIEIAKNAIESIEGIVDLATGDALSWSATYFDTELQDICSAEYNDAMESALLSSSAVRYNGDISTTTNPAMLSLENTVDYGTTLLNSEDLPTTLTTNINDELAGLETRELRIEAFEEVAIKFTETILGIVKIAFEDIPGVSFLVGLGDVGLNIAEDFVVSEDSTNAIAVTQVANYGATNGRGIVGTMGYYVQLQHAVSAGAVGGSDYGVGDDTDNYQKININYCLCVGEKNVNVSSDYKGNDKNSNILSYGDDDGFSPSENFVNADKYDDYGFDFGDVGSSSRWALTSGYPFALPNSNRYTDNYDDDHTLNKE